MLVDVSQMNEEMRWDIHLFNGIDIRSLVLTPATILSISPN
jgi:hypothetical protein